ncbi:N-acetyltransferase [Clostridium gelidum]|uniref:N-acetyltransferase n=1 Tax=Clostridium gelidum TaxID=704125 RepID=A0ABM7T3W1_9CLOT|nr:GNAT family N-acetyltransferase [Clostridium gelidum]BCZ46560.1 N-acetyltransferase [Clostridium gelidum]
MNYRITDIPTEQDKDEIFQELLKYNLERIECKDIKELGIFLEDEQGKKVAGIVGDTHGNWLEIEYLWVSETLRGQDIGTEIISKAELIAKERGCKYVFLNTFSFQAKGFYLKLGYQEVFSLKAYPLTGERHYFIKKL